MRVCRVHASPDLVNAARANRDFFHLFKSKMKSVELHDL